MNRRIFLQAAAGAAALASIPGWAQSALSASSANFGNLLILVELKGANDGLNTVVPFADQTYYSLRPRIGIKREEVLQLSERAGFHPGLAPLLPLWKNGQLAVIEGVGYPNANLSHFRSIEIWDTASGANEYLHDGWLARAFAANPVPRSYLADGVVVGSNDMGPVENSPRSVALVNTDQFLRQAKFAERGGYAKNPALNHILQVENNIVEAAAGLNGHFEFKTQYPAGNFGSQVKTAAQVAANKSGVAALRLSLGGFDTHQNQPNTHANLMKTLAEGLVALQASLQEIGRWNNTLVMTYSEFGRRPRENQSGGTDHGTAAPQFVMGGRVKGGLYGQAPQLARLDGNGNLPYAVDFRDLYATVLERWWGVPAQGVLGARFAGLDLVRAA
ncbi:MAG: Twin-arginine translocation pathway signal sequence protein [Betaproteobacteria bacterium]|nr:Twin-arginine translocation pathway signal sequence protein [Betaproteobacteria bacterium]